MAQLRGDIMRIGDGRQIDVWLCDANYPGCAMFGPIFRYPKETNVLDATVISPRYEMMYKLGWGHFRDGGSDVCPKCIDRFVKEN